MNGSGCLRIEPGDHPTFRFERTRFEARRKSGFPDFIRCWLEDGLCKKHTRWNIGRNCVARRIYGSGHRHRCLASSTEDTGRSGWRGHPFDYYADTHVLDRFPSRIWDRVLLEVSPGVALKT